MSSDTDARLTRTGSALAKENIHIYICTKTADIRWLTGFSRIFDDEQAHFLVIVSELAAPAGPQRLLHTDTRYSGAMRQQMDGVLDKLDDERKPHRQFLVECVEGLGLTRQQSADDKIRIAIEADLPLSSYRAITSTLDQLEGCHYELVEKIAFIESLRAVKDASEIATMRAAQAITDAGFAHMLEFLRPGLSETEVAIELEFFMRHKGAEGLAFPVIAASGPNSAIPHAVPGERILQKGDFMLMDFGARVDGYCSDMTRTVVLGKADEKQKLIYQTVLQAQTETIQMVKPGTSLQVPQEHVNDIFAAAGFDQLPHGLGHGVGIDIHELPVLSVGAAGQLVAGNVVTVEPGIYTEGFGGVRIEDYGVVTDNGFDNFTASPKELLEL